METEDFNGRNARPANGKSDAFRGIPREMNEPESDRVTGPDALKLLLQQLMELQSYVKFYIAAQKDGFSAKINRLVALAVLGIVGAIAGLVMIATAASMLLHGIAGGLAALWNGPVWSGELTTGFLLLALLLGGGYFFKVRSTGSALRERQRQYNVSKAAQQKNFGRSVDERAVS